MPMHKRLWLGIIVSLILLHPTQTTAERETVPQQQMVTNPIIERGDDEVSGIRFIELSYELYNEASIKNVEENDVKEKEQIVKQEEPKIEYEYIDLGEFRISHYCHCAKCNGVNAYKPCKNGDMPKVNHTIAVDPSVIPLNSYVWIDGITYKAMDTGGAIKGNRLDLFVSDHQEALELGIKYKHVYLIRRKG
jgi:3D (Asp-Asp-Asp) domain-containing protein